MTKRSGEEVREGSEATSGLSPAAKKKLGIPEEHNNQEASTTPPLNNATKSPRKLEKLGLVAEPRDQKRTATPQFTERPIEAPTEITCERRKSFNVIANVAGPLIAKAIMYGRKKVEEKDYHSNLEYLVGKSGGKLTAEPLKIQTEYGDNVSAVEIKQAKHSDKTIVVFQGQRGNFQEMEQLERMREIALTTGCNVVAFNYRDNPISTRSFIEDAAAVSDYLIRTSKQGKGIAAGNITFYGESFGGAVAAETAALLRENKNGAKEVNAMLVRTPNSLVEAIKGMDLNKLTGYVSSAANAVKKLLTDHQYNRVFDAAGGDYNTSETIKKLDRQKVTVVNVRGDEIIGETASTKHTNAITGVVSGPEKHNTRLQEIKLWGGQNAMDRLQKISNSTSPTNTQTFNTSPGKK
jgi:hypothetical protein